MGIFSIYSGLLYNDIFSLSLNIFGSGWHNVYDEATLNAEAKRTMTAGDPGVYSGPYFMGLDPAWQVGASLDILNRHLTQNGQFSLYFSVRF